MKLYFYTNKNVVFEFLGRNVIAPEMVVKDIKRYYTVGTAMDSFLFITHKKLDRASRERGIADPEFVYPITMELSDLNPKDGYAVLVSMVDTSYQYSWEPLVNYDEQKHIGACLIGEIPFSRINKIYFDTQDEMDMFSRPSPDYWYPVNKFELLPEGFSETMMIELEQEKVITLCGCAKEDIVLGIRGREKRRASVLNFINGTHKWQCGKFLFNIDTSMQQLLEVPDEQISMVLQHYGEMKGSGKVEYLTLCGEGSPSEIFNQIIYNRTYELLIKHTFNAQKQPEDIVEILNLLREMLASECLNANEQKATQIALCEITKLICDDSNKSPEEILESIPEQIDVLKAVLFVAKNPNRYERFLDALEVYHADQLTRRRAAVLWGAFNGLYGMSGEGFNKDNQKLWQFIEAYVREASTTIRPSLSVDEPDKSICEGRILDILLVEERLVTADEVRLEIISMPKERLTDSLYKKLLEAAEAEYGSKKKAENKGYAHSIASINAPEICMGQTLSSSIKKILEQLLRDCKSSKPNKEKLFEDYVIDEKKFGFVFDLDTEYWKKAFNWLMEKKHES